MKQLGLVLTRRSGAALALAAAAIVAATSTPARAEITMDDLVGRWCGGPGVDIQYRFTRTRLTVYRRDGSGRPGIYDIKDVEGSDDWINIMWERGGNTVYWKFSVDGQTMYKHENETGDRGPEQEFHRC